MRYLLLTLLILFTSCRSKEVELSPLTIETISGLAVSNRVMNKSNYKNYSYMPDHEGLLPGQSPHGSLHKIYINKVLKNSIPNSDRKAPNGSIIVKENYSANEKLEKLTIMTKVRGYSPDSGDWFWTVLSPSGNVLTEGSPQGCISCHSGMRKNDFVIVRKLDE